MIGAEVGACVCAWLCGVQKGALNSWQSDPQLSCSIRPNVRYMSALVRAHTHAYRYTAAKTQTVQATSTVTHINTHILRRVYKAHFESIKVLLKRYSELFLCL